MTFKTYLKTDQIKNLSKYDILKKINFICNLQLCLAFNYKPIKREGFLTQSHMAAEM
jgi:hypothetical protein